jgi:soluble lytic murein transglycosylase-like protein
LARRLVALLLIACACGAAAVTVSNARAGKPSVRATHIPAIPATTAVGNRCPIPAAFRQAFVYAAGDTRLPLALLTAVARVESQFQQHARSSQGAHGLLQVMPTTASELKLDSSLPGENVLAGARYLRLQFDRFPSSDLALAAYNAGPTAVASAGGAPSEETLTYVADVTSIWRSLAGCR